MNRKLYNDDMLIKTIRSGGVERDHALKHLFGHDLYRVMVGEIVTKAGGTIKYVDKVFEDSIVQLDRVIRRFEYKEDSFSLFFEKEAKKKWCYELQINEIARNRVLGDISKDLDLQRQVFAAITKNSGRSEDAQDCYQNGLLLLNSQLIEGKFRGGAIKGFFYQICYNLWRNELKKHKSTPLSNRKADLSISQEDPQKVLENKERAELLNKIFGQLGASCQKILQLKYFVIDQFSMDEIARQMGLKSAQNASNALSKCRKGLLKLLNEHEHAYIWNRSM